MKVNITRFQQHLISKGYNLGKWGADNDFGKMTKAATKKYIQDLCKRDNVEFLPSNPYWFRMDDDFTDKFSDFMAVVDDVYEVVSISNATTKPGKYWVSNPVTVGGIKGTGCRVAGQTKNSHRYEKGKNKWSGRGFFRQIADLFIYRDGNKDSKLDKIIKQTAKTWFGFFLHPMGKGFSIWNWSAGCLGTPLDQWLVNVDPYFTHGQVISDTIFEV